MPKFIVTLASLLILSTYHCISTAWVLPREVLKRASAIVSISTAIVTSTTQSIAVTTTATDINFAGSYSDPFHVNCQRIITVPTPKSAIITGTDGTPNCPVDGSGTPWKLTGTIDGSNILVDFTPKGGPKNLLGVFDTDGIKWPDGNKWTLN